MDLDNGFISCILASKNKEVIKNALKCIPTSMLFGEEREIYKFIQKYYKDSKGSTPSIKAVKGKFGSFEFESPEDDITFFIEEIRERAKYDLLTIGSAKMQESLIGKNSAEALKIIQKTMRSIGKLEINDASTMSSGLDNRIARFEQARENKGIIGFQVGLPSIDKHIGGLQDEMFVILGKPGVGKTTLMLMIMNSVWKQVEAPICIVSNEMSKEKIQVHIDSIVGKFSTSRYRKGNLDAKEEKRLRNLNTVYDTRHEVYIIQGAGRSVDDIEYEIMAVEPAMLFVDGLYLTDMGYNDPTKDTTAASRAYQRITKKYNLPVVLTSQLINENEAKYARAIQEDADIVLKLFRSIPMKEDQVMGLKFLKIREEDSDLKCYMDWNFDQWKFGETAYDEPDMNAEMQHA